MNIKIQEHKDFANASMKEFSIFILNNSAKIGLNLSSHETLIKKLFETGGYGLLPAIATIDDILQLKKIITHITPNGASLSEKMGCVSVGSEILFDLYELSSSVGRVCGISFLENIVGGSSIPAMTIKSIGGVVLTLSVLDKLYSEFSQKRGFLGATPNLIDENSNRTLIQDTLRVGEVGFATISNLSLLVGLDEIFSKASLVSNIFKYARMSH